jgi:anti-sigma B factor antagonist
MSAELESSEPHDHRLRHRLGFGRHQASVATPWEVDTTPEGLVVRGEIDLGTADEFREKLLEVMTRATPSSLRVDLSSVTFMDSAALRSLVAATEASSGTDITVQASTQVWMLLRVTGLAEKWPNVVVIPPEGPQP